MNRALLLITLGGWRAGCASAPKPENAWWKSLSGQQSQNDDADFSCRGTRAGNELDHLAKCWPPGGTAPGTGRGQRPGVPVPRAARVSAGGPASARGAGRGPGRVPPGPALEEIYTRVFDMAAFQSVHVAYGAPDDEEATVPVVIDVKE